MAMQRAMLTPITPSMVIQEINRYADSEFRYAGNADERAVEAMVREMGRTEEARRRYLGGRGT
jgi:predicted phosphoribosyltransferase